MSRPRNGGIRRMRQERNGSFTDAALVERCRKGDMRAFAALVAKYQDRLYNLVFRMCGQATDAEELTQETFLRALERIGQFRGDSQFYTWLFRIAANLTITHRRRSRRLRMRSLSGPAGSEASQAPSTTGQGGPAPDAGLLADERRRRVAEALSELEDEHRLVVLLRDVEGMDYGRIARVVGVPVGTVKSRLHRARCILKAKLAKMIE